MSSLGMEVGSEELWYNSRYELSAFMVAYIFETLLHIVFLVYICSQSLVISDKQRTKEKQYCSLTCSLSRALVQGANGSYSLPRFTLLTFSCPRPTAYHNLDLKRGPWLHG